MKRVLMGLPLVLLAGLGVASAADQYPYDIAKRDPAALRAWRGVVPGDLKKQRWIYSLDGTSGPMEQVTLHGRPFYYGEVCIPHDCGGNFIAFLVSRGGGEAFGAIASTTLAMPHRYFGAPDAEARDLLDKELKAQQ